MQPSCKSNNCLFPSPKLTIQTQSFHQVTNPSKMASSSLRMTTVSPTQLSGFIKPSNAQLKPRNFPPFQVSCKGDSESNAPKRLSVTRRDVMVCLTTLSVTGLGASSSPKITEARMKKDEIRRKIKEKLEMLREKAGLSKRKENDKEKPPSVPPSKKENVLPLEPPFPLPSPPPSLKKPLVEVTL